MPVEFDLRRNYRFASAMESLRFSLLYVDKLAFSMLVFSIVLPLYYLKNSLATTSDRHHHLKTILQNTTRSINSSEDQQPARSTVPAAPAEAENISPCESHRDRKHPRRIVSHSLPLGYC